MSYIKKWNADEVIRQIELMSWTASDPHLDGFSTWPIKQDLYRIKWALDRGMSKCPTYSMEEEFLQQHEKEVTWNTLNEKTDQ